MSSSTHEILSNRWQEPPDEGRREEYADYFDSAGHRYPRRLQLFVNGSKVITANVSKLEPSAFDETLLVPPKDAIERRQCKDMKQAVAIKAPTPNPMSRLSGDITVVMTVLSDGSVTDIHLVGSSARSLDEVTLETLNDWKFKPAMCGTEPVASDIDVVVSFRPE